MRKFLTAFVMACGLVSPAVAQTLDPVAGERPEARSIASAILSEERRIFVHTPSDYDNSTERYPVLYVLNRDENFDLAVHLAEYLADKGAIPPLIVVGVPHAGGSIGNAEYVPFDGAEPSPRADRFLRFLTEELAPHLEARYRTHPSRILIGHSLAGLFTTYALLEAPDAFDAYLALSPSFHHGPPMIEAVRSRGARIGEGRSRVLYMSLGGEEYHRVRAPFDEMVEVLDAVAPGTLRHHLGFEAHLDHRAVPLVGMHNGLMSVFAGYHLSMPDLRERGFAGVVAHYDRMSAELGYEVKPQRRAIESIQRYFSYPDHAAHPAIADHVEAIVSDAGRLLAHYYGDGAAE